jgi:hypothetical protein
LGLKIEGLNFANLAKFREFEVAGLYLLYQKLYRALNFWAFLAFGSYQTAGSRAC